MTRETAEHVAELAAMFVKRGPSSPHEAARVAGEFHKAARALHKMDERACNEDLGCPRCKGEGRILHEESTETRCKACAGTGLTTGKREARILERVRTLAGAYDLRVYRQGDCRGWPLYLIPQESGPASEDDSHYSSRGTAVCPH